MLTERIRNRNVQNLSVTKRLFRPEVDQRMVQYHHVMIIFSEQILTVIDCNEWDV